MVVTGDTAKERIADIHASGFAMLHKAGRRRRPAALPRAIAGARPQTGGRARGNAA